MSKRSKQQAKSGTYPEYDALDTDQLLNERRSLGMQIESIGRQHNRLRIRIDYLNARIRMARDGENGIIISDHAVVRYMERVMGIDVPGVRAEIRARAALQKLGHAPDQVVKDDGTSFAIYNGNCVATVWRDAADALEPEAHDG